MEEKDLAIFFLVWPNLLPYDLGGKGIIHVQWNSNLVLKKVTLFYLFIYFMFLTNKF